MKAEKQKAWDDANYWIVEGHQAEKARDEQRARAEKAEASVTTAAKDRKALETELNTAKKDRDGWEKNTLEIVKLAYEQTGEICRTSAPTPGSTPPLNSWRAAPGAPRPSRPRGRKNRKRPRRTGRRLRRSSTRPRRTRRGGKRTRLRSSGLPTNRPGSICRTSAPTPGSTPPLNSCRAAPGAPRPSRPCGRKNGKRRAGR